MNNKTYRSGGTPKKGDIVKCVDSGWGYTITKGKNYTVENVFPDTKTILVEIRSDSDEYSKYSATRFELVENDTTSVSDTPIYIIMDANHKFVKRTNDYKAAVTELLTKDHTLKLHVYEYLTTGSTEKPKVEWNNQQHENMIKKSNDKRENVKVTIPNSAPIFSLRP
jgi:metal-dependent amidase/aminoacylase/carboxypeptidase family protein